MKTKHDCVSEVVTLTNEAANELGKGNRGNLAFVIAVDDHGNMTPFVTNQRTAIPASFPRENIRSILDQGGISYVRAEGSNVCIFCYWTAGGDRKCIEVRVP